MERIALRKMIDWNDSKRKKPLIVWGARQVGKTYLVKEIFAETYYKDNYIYIDCKKETRHIALLMSFRQSTICFVRIANIFCVGIRMSEQIYKEADPFIIGINDCDGTYKTYNLLSLIGEINKKMIEEEKDI